MKPCWFAILFFLRLIVFSTSRQLTDIQDVIKHRSYSTHIKNQTEVLRKINGIIRDGAKHLQIITDFDNTLTVDSGIDGKHVLNSFEMLRLVMPQSYRDEEYRLYQIYKPIEDDPNMTVGEKLKFMVDWYISAQSLMKGLKFPREELKDIAQNMTDCFRSGISDLIVWSESHDVPIIVLSSGLGDAVVAAMEAANLTSRNIIFVSNFLDLANDDDIKGLKGDPIHSLNKNEAAIKNTQFYDRVKNRKNVILLGDTIGDTNMADGLDDLDNVVKIGYLQKKRKENLNAFIDNFDIVLEDDQTLDLLNNILKRVHYNGVSFQLH